MNRSNHAVAPPAAGSKKLPHFVKKPHQDGARRLVMPKNCPGNRHTTLPFRELSDSPGGCRIKARIAGNERLFGLPGREPFAAVILRQKGSHPVL